MNTSNEGYQISATLPSLSSNGGNQNWYNLKQPSTQTLGRNGSRRRGYNFREAFINSKNVIIESILRRRKAFKKKSSVCESQANILQFPEIATHFDPKCHRKLLNYFDGHLVSGQIDQLIKLLVPTHSYFPDRNYIFTFILCSRLFITPESVLEQLYDTVKGNMREYKEQKSSIPNMVIQLLQEWCAYFPYDFKRKAMMNQFNRICNLCKKSDPDLSSSINLISCHLMRNFDELLRYINLQNTFEIPCDEKQIKLLDICENPGILSRQLTIIELEKLSKVSPEQFVEKFIIQDMTVSTMDLSKKTSTLELYVAWFNRLSLLVATEVCSCPDMKGRIKIINFFIDVSKQCLKIGNLNSLMAIIVGLNINSVARMTKTWNKCYDSRFKKLEKVVSPDRNFYRYRKTLHKKLRRGCEFVVPIFSIFVKDLYLLNEGIKDRLPNNLINFQKFWHLSKQVNDMITLKSKVCTYNADESIISYLINTPVCNEDMLYKSSFDVEKPRSSFERNRYQSVKKRIRIQ